MDFYAYSWTVDDSNDDRTIVRCYALNEREETVALDVEGFEPYFYVELPSEDWRDALRDVETLTRRNGVKVRPVTDMKHLYSERSAVFARCSCPSAKRLNFAAYAVKKCGRDDLRVHEESASAVLQLTSARRIPTATWLRADGCVPITGKRRRTRCDREYSVRWTDLRPVDESATKPAVRPKVAAFDIEVNSEIVNSMPADRPDDAVFQISFVVQREPSDRRKILLTLRGVDTDCDDELLRGIEVKSYATEELLLVGFAETLKSERPNALIGYNVLGFDIAYLIKRCERYGLTEELALAGANAVKPAPLREISWSSSAYGDQSYSYVDWEGVLVVDLMQIVKRDYKLDNYKLDTVASYLVGAEKDPVHFKEIFHAYASKRMARVGKYCVQDSNLCADIFDKIHCWIYLSEVAAICQVSMFDVYARGSQCKTYGRLYAHCVRRGDVVVTSNGYRCANGERYIGAFVLEPVPGRYDNVVSLDFASMYPSVIIAYNICYSTYVPDESSVPPERLNVFEWEDHVGCEHDPKTIAHADLSRRIEALDDRIRELRAMRDAARGDAAKRSFQARINALREEQKPFREERAKTKTAVGKKRRPRRKGRWDDDEDIDDGDTVEPMCAKRRYAFYKPEYRTGVVPSIIRELLDTRKRVKREMAVTADAVERIVLDKKQNALKVLANSQYGGMGVRRGYLPFMPGAMCVTYVGRELIRRAGSLAEKRYGLDWIYTDTDSTYVRFKTLTDTREIWDRAIEAAESISAEFPPGVDIEFERVVYESFVILTKKKYMYRPVDRDGRRVGDVGKRGCVLARRDNSFLLRDVYGKTVSMIFDKRPLEDVRDFIVDYLSDVFRDILPHSHYVITKSVRSIGAEGDVADGAVGVYRTRKPAPEDATDDRAKRAFLVAQCPGQVQLAERMRLRGRPIDTGSRIEYVVVARPGVKSVGGRMEEYEYFAKRRSILRIDKLYYVECLVNPLDELLRIVFGDSMRDFVSTQLAYRKKFARTVRSLKRAFDRARIDKYEF